MRNAELAIKTVEDRSRSSPSLFRAPSQKLTKRKGYVVMFPCLASLATPLLEMTKQHLRFFLIVVVLMAFLPSHASAITDPLDVIALQDLYKKLNYPPQLDKWRSDVGDPCGESWKGVSCSGSSVISIQLPGLNLGGYLDGQLHNLHNLKHLDVSFNNIQGEIPYGLPPNATHLNLACNKFNQNIPHSLTSMKNLEYLNLSHNSLSGPIANVFTDLKNLKEMDLSYNHFTGDLPSSFATLKNLTRVFLQNNRFTGSVVFLADLPLTYLNIQSNDFSGIIPTQFQSIPNLWLGNRLHPGSNHSPLVENERKDLTESSARAEARQIAREIIRLLLATSLIVKCVCRLILFVLVNIQARVHQD